MVRIRKEYSKGFTTTSNTIIRDERLTWKARGIFNYLWSMPDDWDFYAKEVAKHAKDGIHSLDSGLDELAEYGYLERTRLRDKKGRFGAPVWVLHDDPVNDQKPKCGFPILDNPKLEKPILDNRTLLNKYPTKDIPTNKKQKEREIIKGTDTNSKLSLLSWSDSLGAMTDQISKLLLDASDQGMSIDLLQKAVDITKYADPGTPYGYLKSVVSDWLNQGIYTMQDWQQHQQKKQAAKYRDIPDIPIYKI